MKLNLKEASGLLLNGVNHVAILTNDTERLAAFYRDIFEAEVDGQAAEEEGVRLTFIRIGETAELNVFEIDGNTEADRQTPMFQRGRIDHLGLQAASIDEFDETRRRLIESGASEEFVTDFGAILTVFFRDPDGLAGVTNPPGTPAARYVST